MTPAKVAGYSRWLLLLGRPPRGRQRQREKHVQSCTSRRSSCTGWENSWTGCKKQEAGEEEKEGPAPEMRPGIGRFNSGRELSEVGYFVLFLKAPNRKP